MGSDFIRDIIDDDLRSGRQTTVATRFPPEPNGYLHIGHAKAICVSFGIAQQYQGTCNLRYDDTNPIKEDMEYVDSIERDVRWLGFTPTAVLFSGDYFPKMYELAERLVHRRQGVRLRSRPTSRSANTAARCRSPARPARSARAAPEENLALLRKMKAGELPDGACTLRAKIDMASANMKMRDPLLYRIRHAHHHRTGDAWVIYPMYDWAHPIEDAIEGITYSLCTLEFENNRELYDWVRDNTGPWVPLAHQYEFARLAARVHGDEQAQATHARAGQARHRLGRSADADDHGDAPARLLARGAARVLRHDRHREGELVRRYRQARVLRARRSQQERAARARRVATDRGRARRRRTSTTLDAPYFPPDVGKPGSRSVPIGTRAVHRSRRLARRSTGRLSAARAGSHGAPALRTVHHGDRRRRARRRGPRDEAARARSMPRRSAARTPTTVARCSA